LLLYLSIQEQLLLGLALELDILSFKVKQD
jgi:hypothetical protein